MRVKILLCCLVFFGFVAFSQSMQLVKERNRVLSYSLPIELKNQIAKETKGFKENVPGIFMGFGMVMVFGALFLQGILLIIS